jgi:hypothetical protein
MGSPADHNTNWSYKIDFADGTSAMWKPSAGQYSEDTVRSQIANDEQFLREAAASHIGRALGLGDMVPTVVVRSYDSSDHADFRRKARGIGAVIDWAEGHDPVKGYNEYDYGTNEGQIAKAAAFNFLINNTDRHGHNWLVNDDGEIHLIDHGFTLPENPMDIRSRFVDQCEQLDTPVPMEVKNWKWKDVQAGIRRYRLGPKVEATAKRQLKLLQRFAGKSFMELIAKWTEVTHHQLNRY